MSSSSIVTAIIVMMMLIGAVISAPAPSVPKRHSADSRDLPFDLSTLAGLSSMTPSVQGATMQLFIDAACKTSAGEPLTFNSTLSDQCQSPVSNTSWISNCVASGSSLTFEYSVWNVSSCQGNSVISFKASGDGSCLPTTITQDGVPVPFTFYASIQCRFKESERTSEESMNHKEAGRFKTFKAKEDVSKQDKKPLK